MMNLYKVSYFFNNFEIHEDLETEQNINVVNADIREEIFNTGFVTISKPGEKLNFNASGLTTFKVLHLNG